MRKEIRDDGSIVVQGDVEIRIPLRLRFAMQLLQVSPYVILLSLVPSIAKMPELVMSTVYGLSQDEIAQNIPPMTVMGMFALVFFGIMGVFLCFIFNEVCNMPKVLGIGAVILVTLLSVAPTRPVPTLGLYIGLLELGSFITGYLLRAWIIFARSKTEEIYTKEVQKQATDIFEKEILPNIQEDIDR